MRCALCDARLSRFGPAVLCQACLDKYNQRQARDQAAEEQLLQVIESLHPCPICDVRHLRAPAGQPVVGRPR